MTGQPHHRLYPLRKEKPLESTKYEEEAEALLKGLAR
jgi:hypothetical protein